MDLIKKLFNLDPTNTREGLPVLTGEIKGAFIRDMQRSLEQENAILVLNKYSDEIGTENPEVTKYIVEMIRAYPPETQGMVLAGFFSLYLSLKAQAAHNKISECLRENVN